MNIRNNDSKQQLRRGRHWARRTHRLLGVSSLVFIFLISLTGLVLNHADTFRLSTHYISGPLMLSLYGIDAPPIDVAFETGGANFATADKRLFANGRVIADDVTSLRGAIAKGDFAVLASDREFFVVTLDGSLIERYSPDDSDSISKLGMSGDMVIVRKNERHFVFDANSMRLQSLPGIINVAWSQPVTPTEQQVATIATASLGKTLSWERVLSDTHSGRILPNVGRYLADITAICLLYLCITGLFLWFRRR